MGLTSAIGSRQRVRGAFESSGALPDSDELPDGGPPPRGGPTVLALSTGFRQGGSRRPFRAT